MYLLPLTYTSLTFPREPDWWARYSILEPFRKLIFPQKAVQTRRNISTGTGFFFFGFETFCRLQVAPEWPGLIEGKLRLQAFSFSEQVSVQGFCMYYKLSSLLVRVDLRLAL